MRSVSSVVARIDQHSATLPWRPGFFAGIKRREVTLSVVFVALAIAGMAVPTRTAWATAPPGTPAAAASDAPAATGEKPPADEGAVLIARARAEATKGDRGRAIRTLEEAEKAFSDRAEIHWLLGVLYRDTGRLAKAERAFRKATQLAPEMAWAWSDLAAVLERQGANREALEAANKAVALDREDPGMRADRAIIRYRLGQLDAAIEDVEWATEHQSDDAYLAVDHALMRLTRGKPADRRRALELLTLARAMLSDDNAVALAHAQALLAAGRTLPAKRAFDALLQRNPRQAWANYGRALLAWRAGDFDRARIHAKKARSVLPHVFTSRAHNKRQFFAADAKPFLRWMDGELAVPGSKQAGKKDKPGVSATLGDRPVAIERVDVVGRCERARVMSELQTLDHGVTSCFGDHTGQLEVRFSISSGRTTGASRTGESLSQEADQCVLRLLKPLVFPKEANCRVQTTWSRRLSALPTNRPNVLQPDMLAPKLRAEPDHP